MKKLIVFLLVVLIAAAAMPWALYGVGLWNTDGRPTPPTQMGYDAFEATQAWNERAEVNPPALRAITPWHFYHLLWCSQNDQTLEDFLTCGDLYPGLRASAYVAKNYLITHIHRDGILWRYLSRTALTIWLSNAWNKDDLMAELVRLRRAGYSPK